MYIPRAPRRCFSVFLQIDAANRACGWCWMYLRMRLSAQFRQVCTIKMYFSLCCTEIISIPAAPSPNFVDIGPTVKAGRRRIRLGAGRRDLHSRVLVYHCLGDVVLRLGMHAAMFRLPSFLGTGTATATLLPLQRHFVGVNGFAVREGMESLSSFSR